MASQFVELSLETLESLNMGEITEAFKIHMDRMVKDCINRPGDDRKRNVTLQVSLVPVKEINGNTISCEGAKGKFQVKSKAPDHESSEIDFGINNKGQIYFNPDSPRDHRQGTMFGGQEEE